MRGGKSMEMKEMVVAITGGASGLGESAVRNVVDKGGKAVILDLNKELGMALEEELGEATLFVETNVADESSVQHALNEAVNRFGKINGVVNCAGVAIAKKVIGRKGLHE